MLAACFFSALCWEDTLSSALRIRVGKNMQTIENMNSWNDKAGYSNETCCEFHWAMQVFIPSWRNCSNNYS